MVLFGCRNTLCLWFGPLPQWTPKAFPCHFFPLIPQAVNTFNCSGSSTKIPCSAPISWYIKTTAVDKWGKPNILCVSYVQHSKDLMHSCLCTYPQAFLRWNSVHLKRTLLFPGPWVCQELYETLNSYMRWPREEFINARWEIFISALHQTPVHSFQGPKSIVHCFCDHSVCGCPPEDFWHGCR